MDCIVTVVRADIHTREVRVRDVTTPAEALAKVQKSLKRDKVLALLQESADATGWELRDRQFALECGGKTEAETA